MEGVIRSVRVGPVLFLEAATVPTWIRRLYTYTPKAHPHFPPPKRLCLVTVLPGGTIGVPRDLGLLESLGAIDVTDLQRPAPSVLDDPSCRGFAATLDPTRHQVEAVDRVVRALTTSPYGGGACLSLPVGFGKTVCALAIACRIAERVLVLVHTDMLARQWVDRITATVTGASVALVTPATYEAVRADSATYTHTVMLMQTLLARAQTTVADAFDLVLVDETHHLAAPTLSRCMAVAGARYRLGLSATIERKDGMHTLLHHILGPVAYSATRETNPNVTVHVHQYTAPVMNDTSIVAAVTATAADDTRTAFLVDIVLDLYTRGRHVIVMSDRKHQLTRLEALLGGRAPVAWAVGGSPPMDMSRRPVVLATYAYCAEGMDVPELDACVLATSRRDVRQCIGRILRQHGHDPCVIDVVDTASQRLRAQGSARRKWYTTPLDRHGLAATVVIHSASH
jgi:superfamily II DNA or RNA helicase